ncbi:MAG TPA: glycosyltransferase family 2 protein [Pirellulales bacterium]|jgi:dolichol-phosphate mannosyltransferase|nr:glycosyltransferase family 2 protein [Pirellulales bacterium]
MTRVLIALPVYNEVGPIQRVLDQVLQFASEILVVDDGSTDGTTQLLAQRRDIRVLTHAKNQGYGGALISAFHYAIEHQYDVLVTLDSDGQHQPSLIPKFVAACETADIVSGSRYKQHFPGDSIPPPERRKINGLVTAELNRRLELNLTDAFCGFKSYRVEGLKKLRIHERGYAMPLELWVQAVHAGLKIVELPVPLVYLDETRSFGGVLDDARTRLEYYHLIIDRSFAAVAPPALEMPDLGPCLGESVA